MRELHNVDAEKAVLGSFLIDPSAIRQVEHYLSPADFWHQGNRMVFEAIMTVHQEGMTVDSVTVGDTLDRRGVLAEMGGIAYLLDLIGQVPSALHVTDYARIVALRSVDRQIEAVAQEIVGFAFADHPPEEKVALVQAAVEGITLIGTRPEAMTADQGAELLAQLAEEYAEDPLTEDAVRGWSTGLIDLDRMLRGFKPGLYLVGGVTHVGKTAFVVQLALNVAREGGRVLIIETEDTTELMWARVYALVSGVAFDDVERGLDYEQLEWYKQALDKGREWDLEILAKPITVPAIAQEVRARKLDLLVVDNLETPSLAYKGDGEWQRFRAAAYGLLSIAQEHNLSVLTTMQVSRHGLAKRKSKIPRMEDLYGADGPSQAASVVLTLHRDELWTREATDPVMEVYCYKDKLSHRGAGQSAMFQFGDCGQLRNLAIHSPIEF